MGLFSRRRRDAPRHPVPERWIGPHGGPVTAVGNLDSPLEASVDSRGLVSTGAGWSIDWWIGADDRWHVPAREVAVRQRLVDDTPVVETAMRVPSGDIVQRVFAVRAGADELVVVEWENQSPVPVALAVAVRPYDHAGSGAIGRIDVEADTAVVADGRVVLLLPKPPNRAASSYEDDVSEQVLLGEAGTDLSSVVSTFGQANAAYVWPLAHRTTVRVAIPLGPTELRKLPSLPTADQVVNGWKVHGDRGVRLVLPDDRLTSAVDANRRSLLFRHDAPGAPVEVAGALDRYGCAVEAAEVLASDPDAAGIAALAGHWHRHRDEALARSVVEDVAHLADRLPKGSPLLLDAAELLEVGGEVQAASAARKLAGPVAGSPSPRWSDLTALLDGATPTWSWPLEVSARFLVLVRDLLVHEVADGLVLLSDVPEDWFGRGVEVHDAPTAFGALSFGIRWHGDRPALLWELEPHAGVGPVRFTVPGLDPTWSTTELRGDALLAPVLPPGTQVTLKRR
ncbi:MAG: hypothetical protein JWN67_4708 [Actinomycetia bacterium]|nr:hypothetical protein [Actinomycetes bacterium]